MIDDIPVVINGEKLIARFTEPLAYLTAKTNGLDDLADHILASAGIIMLRYNWEK